MKQATIHLCLFDEPHFSSISPTQVVKLECIETRNTTRCNNHDDLLHISFTIFGGLYITQLNIYGALIAKIVRR